MNMKIYELFILGRKSGQQEITLDELRAGIAYNATFIGNLTQDEKEILELGFMSQKMTTNPGGYEKIVKALEQQDILDEFPQPSCGKCGRDYVDFFLEEEGCPFCGAI